VSVEVQVCGTADAGGSGDSREADRGNGVTGEVTGPLGTDVDGGSPERLTETQWEIIHQCDEIAELLIAKNVAYGNSFQHPCNVFSKIDALGQLDVRIDDKINRIMKGQEYGTEDTELDLIGYLILKRVIRAMA